MALEVTSIRWNPESLAHLKALAAKQGMTVSALIRGAVVEMYPEATYESAPVLAETLSHTNRGGS